MAALIELRPLRSDFSFDSPERRSRIGAAAVSLIIQGGIIAALLYGLAPTDMDHAVLTDRFAAITFARTAPPPRPRPNTAGAAKSGAAAPANLVSKASPVQAMPIPLQRINPLPAALRPGSDTGQSAGAAAVIGPGKAAGGVGYGSGTGAGGTGTGSGLGDGNGNGGTDPDWTGGRVKNADYPAAAREARISGTTQTTISVSAQGRPTACRVIRSSGSLLLDATTCRLVLQRFRFRPARASGGQAIAAEVDYDQEWVAPPPLDPEPDDVPR